MRGRPSGGSVARATIVMVVMFLALTMTFSARALAQTATEAPASQRELAELRDRVAELSNRIDFSLAFFALIIAVGSGISVYGFAKGESRAKEAFELFMSGEKATQDRAAEVHEKFLTPSKETLELVNAALEISKQESDRRTKSIVVRAEEMLRELDGQAKLLISRVPEEDVHDLASNSTRRAELCRLARKIEIFASRLIFEQAPQLTPHTLFILGIDFHLNQNYDESLESWERVVVDKEAPDELKRLAWYWIGREQNNLGRFDEAEQSFANARRTASGVMDLELQRNALESQFFSQGPPRAAALIDPFEQLRKMIASEGNGSRVNSVRGQGCDNPRQCDDRGWRRMPSQTTRAGARTLHECAEAF
ncbi:MAG: hypothetical protein ACRDZ4_18100 [Egibacteraceae bacterium]